MMIIFISYNNNYDNGGNYHLERGGGGGEGGKRGLNRHMNRKRKIHVGREKEREREMICSVLYLTNQALF